MCATIGIHTGNKRTFRGASEHPDHQRKNLSSSPRANGAQLESDTWRENRQKNEFKRRSSRHKDLRGQVHTFERPCSNHEIKNYALNCWGFDVHLFGGNL